MQQQSFVSTIPPSHPPSSVYGMMAISTSHQTVTTLAPPVSSQAAPMVEKRRRESFRPRPSSPGLGLPELWRGKAMIRDEAVAELEEDSDLSY